MSFSYWILSIVGVVIISIMVDIILPDGDTNKYIKGITAILIVYTIVAPLPKFINNDFKIQDTFQDEQVVEVNDSLLNTVFQMRVSMLKDKTAQTLSSCGINGCMITIDVIHESSRLKINNIFINIKNIVIDSSFGNINTNERIKEIVSVAANISKERVIIING